ncbi:unnamed protein product [Arabidopsis lyrata]|nr:unnamed protein product [Arabidopsis lyrata]
MVAFNQRSDEDEEEREFCGNQYAKIKILQNFQEKIELPLAFKSFLAKPIPEKVTIRNHRGENWGITMKSVKNKVFLEDRVAKIFAQKMMTDDDDEQEEADDEREEKVPKSQGRKVKGGQNPSFHYQSDWKKEITVAHTVFCG